MVRTETDVARGHPEQLFTTLRDPACDRWVWRVELETAGVRPSKTERVVNVEILLLRLALKARRRVASSPRRCSATDIASRASGPVWQSSRRCERTGCLARRGTLHRRAQATWSLYDVFWRIHTSRLRRRDNVNNPLIVTPWDAVAVDPGIVRSGELQRSDNSCGAIGAALGALLRGQ